MRLYLIYTISYCMCNSISSSAMNYKYRQKYGSVDDIKTKPRPTDQDIKYAAKTLKISFPKSYILFLRQAGACPLIFDEVFWVGSEGKTYA